MKITYLLNTRFTSILFILFTILQLSACNDEPPGTTTSPIYGGNSPIDITDITDTISGADEVSASSKINLTWTAPSEREDNTTLLLSAIGGYNIYYGSTQGQYINTVSIDDGTADSYTFNDLSTGTYYFVVTTYDTDGRESQYSSEIIKTI